MIKKTCLSFITVALLQTISPVLADDTELFDFDDKERWIIRARAINVFPDESSTVTGLATGTEAKAESVWTPEFDFTYFFTDNVAAELILATSKHDMSTNTGIDLGEVWVLPPTINLQYHFLPEGKWRPYAGAGLGYIFYYNEDSGVTSNIEYDDGISYSLQVGMDYEIDRNWALNADIKRLWHNTDVRIADGAINADIDLDPWVLGVGVAYRF